MSADEKTKDGTELGQKNHKIENDRKLNRVRREHIDVAAEKAMAKSDFIPEQEFNHVALLICSS